MDHLQNVMGYFDQQQPLCAEHDRIPKDLYREFGVTAGLRDENGKGVRLGYLPKRMAAWAEKAFYGTCDKYLSKNPDGSLQLDGICLVAGLGGKDHRDGSLAYYFSEPVVCNDAKGVGPLVLAYTEMIAK